MLRKRKFAVSSTKPLTECKKNGDMCGQHHGVNPPVNYGECCEGFECIHPTGVVGAAGKCEFADSTTMKPNTDHTTMKDPSTTPGTTPATTEVLSTRTSQPVDPNCDQTLGNAGMLAVGTTLGISEMTNCDSSASYAIKQFNMTLPRICETTIDTLLNKLPGEDAAKDQIRTLIKSFGKDPATTKINEVCKCSCAQNSNGRAMCTPNGSSTFLNRCTKEKCCSGCCGQEPSGNQIRGFCTVCSQANCTPNGKSTFLNRCTKEKCCSGCCAQAKRKSNEGILHSLLRT